MDVLDLLEQLAAELRRLDPHHPSGYLTSSC
jgi:hypothetical protein